MGQFREIDAVLISIYRGQGDSQVRLHLRFSPVPKFGRCARTTLRLCLASSVQVLSEWHVSAPRHDPSAVPGRRDFRRETSEQLSICTMNRRVQEEAENPILPPRNVTLKICPEVSGVERLELCQHRFKILHIGCPIEGGRQPKDVNIPH